MKIWFRQTSPLPYELLAEAIQQLTDRGWTYVDSITLGPAKMAQAIQLPGQSKHTVLIVLIVCKEAQDAPEIENITFGGKE